MERSRIRCRPIFVTTQRRSVTTTTQESGWYRFGSADLRLLVPPVPLVPACYLGGCWLLATWGACTSAARTRTSGTRIWRRALGRLARTREQRDRHVRAERKTQRRLPAASHRPSQDKCMVDS